MMGYSGSKITTFESQIMQTVSTKIPLQHAYNRIATESAHIRTESERYTQLSPISVISVMNFVLLACWVGILWGAPHALI